MLPVRIAHWSSVALAVDLRSLALLRVGLGITILFDLAQRALSLRAHYTDQGVLPNAALGAVAAYQRSLGSLHSLSGGEAFIAVLFILQVCAAACLCLGAWTRAAAFVSWVLLCSLHWRNPMVVMSGDRLLALLSFWAMFLPLAARAALHRRVPRTETSVCRSAATTVLLLQIALFYLLAGLAKRGELWWNGDAVAMALGQEAYATSAGQWLRGQQLLTQVLTFGTLALELVGPLLALLTRGRSRLGIVLAFVSFHLGLAIFLSIGLYPLVCIVAWTVFLPTQAWDWVAGAWRKRMGKVLRIAPRPPRRFVGERASSWAAMALFGISLMFALDVRTVHALPEGAHRIARAFYIDQEWRMFAPEPGQLSQRVEVTLNDEQGAPCPVSLSGIRWTHWFWRIAELPPQSTLHEVMVRRLGPVLCSELSCSNGTSQLQLDLQLSWLEPASRHPLQPRRLVDGSCSPKRAREASTQARPR
jgi:hypothetical protein